MSTSAVSLRAQRIVSPTQRIKTRRPRYHHLRAPWTERRTAIPSPVPAEARDSIGRRDEGLACFCDRDPRGRATSRTLPPPPRFLLGAAAAPPPRVRSKDLWSLQRGTYRSNKELGSWVFGSWGRWVAFYLVTTTICHPYHPPSGFFGSSPSSISWCRGMYADQGHQEGLFVCRALIELRVYVPV